MRKSMSARRAPRKVGGDDEEDAPSVQPGMYCPPYYAKAALTPSPARELR